MVKSNRQYPPKRGVVEMKRKLLSALVLVFPFVVIFCLMAYGEGLYSATFVFFTMLKIVFMVFALFAGVFLWLCIAAWVGGCFE